MCVCVCVCVCVCARAESTRMGVCVCVGVGVGVCVHTRVCISVATILEIYHVLRYFYRQYDTLNTLHVMIQVPISSWLS